MRFGGAAAGLFGTSFAEGAPMAQAGRSVADWGALPNAGRDQSRQIQQAILELSAAGQPVIIPAGRFVCAALTLPSNTAILGIPGLTILSASGGAAILNFQNVQNIQLRGLSFAGAGISAIGCRNMSICDCEVLSSSGDGIVCSGSGLFIAGNRAASCSNAAIWVEGDGMATTNLIRGPGRFGLRIGGAHRLGTLSVINNVITGAQTGIAVSNSDAGYALISMNMITGATQGGIRALNGDDLTGKDLTKGGSEAFRNLAIAANVSV
ncbi:MAG: right-handed parallel beta-helix repeat-containing protein [Rhodomicrobium sp.]